MQRRGSTDQLPQANQASQSGLRYLQLLQDFLERRLAYLHGWAKMARVTAITIGQASSLGRKDVAALASGAGFHDLGLLAIPDAILEAERELQPDERRVVNGHVRYGRELLSLTYGNQPEILNIALFHHERPDGGGPLGLAGDMIPPLARIVSVSDAVVAMFSGRPHRKALEPKEILSQLDSGTGTQFDPAVVQAVHRAKTRLFGSLQSMKANPSGQADPKSGAPPASAGRAGRKVSPSATPAPSAPAPAQSGERGDITSRLEHISELSALPTPVCEVIALASNKESDRAQLARAVQQDVALSSKLLAVANSPVYRRSEKRLTTIEESVGSLGFSTVANVAASMSVVRSSAAANKGPVNFTRLWAHSVSAAVIARMLSAGEDTRVQDSRFLQGLMHDFGKFVLIECFPECIESLINAADQQTEVTTLGVDHAHAGAVVMERWNMPAELARAAREHHCCWQDAKGWGAGETKDVVITQLADALAVAFGFDSGLLDYLPSLPPHLLMHCPTLHDLQLADTARAVDRELQQLGALLGVGLPRPEDSRWACGGCEDDLPVVTYVTPGALVLDPVAVWLQQTQMLALREHRLDSAETEFEAFLPLVVCLPPGQLADELRPPLERVLAEYQGVLVAPRPECDRLLQEASGRWLAVTTPVSTRGLTAALDRARARLAAAGAPA